MVFLKKEMKIIFIILINCLSVNHACVEQKINQNVSHDNMIYAKYLLPEVAHYISNFLPNVLVGIVDEYHNSFDYFFEIVQKCSNGVHYDFLHINEIKNENSNTQSKADEFLKKHMTNQGTYKMLYDEDEDLFHLYCTDNQGLEKKIAIPPIHRKIENNYNKSSDKIVFSLKYDTQIIWLIRKFFQNNCYLCCTPYLSGNDDQYFEEKWKNESRIVKNKTAIMPLFCAFRDDEIIIIHNSFDDGQNCCRTFLSRIFLKSRSVVTFALPHDSLTIIDNFTKFGNIWGMFSYISFDNATRFINFIFIPRGDTHMAHIKFPCTELSLKEVQDAYLVAIEIKQNSFLNSCAILTKMFPLCPKKLSRLCSGLSNESLYMKKVFFVTKHKKSIDSFDRDSIQVFMPYYWDLFEFI